MSRDDSVARRTVVEPGDSACGRDPRPSGSRPQVLASRFGLLGVGMVAILLGCGEPAGVLPLGDSGGLMQVLVVFDPDAGAQPVQVVPIDPSGHLDSLAVRSFVGGVPADSAVATSDSSFTDFDGCVARFGSFIGTSTDIRCPVLATSPAYGEDFRIEVTAAGRPVASGSSRVPGDFRVLSASALGSPPGTEGFDAVWTRSAGAYRYVVGLHPASIPDCVNNAVDKAGFGMPCRRSWVIVTADTAVHTVVSASALEAGEGPWQVEVFALDRPLYEYLTSGVGGDYFTVPPVQNVDGGYGVVGSWVWRRWSLEP